MRALAPCAQLHVVTMNPVNSSLAAMTIALAAALAALCAPALAHDRGAAARKADTEQADPPKPKLDRTGRRRVGEASFYGRRFHGRTMANGEPMDPQGDNAASKTLPLGTRARVTNLENGRSAVVTIEDRGPYVPGRIIDVSPATAERLGIEREEGVAPVAVTPIELPEP